MRTARHDAEYLAEENANLRSALKIDLEAAKFEAYRLALGLSPQQTRLVALLHNRRRRFSTREFIHEHLPPKADEEQRSYNFASVLVLQVRRKLGTAFIDTHLGCGYRLSAEALGRCDQVLLEGAP